MNPVDIFHENGKWPKRINRSLIPIILQEKSRPISLIGLGIVNLKS